VNPSLRRHQQDWEDLGDLDPYWATLASPERRFGRWDLDEFFRSGEVEIGRLTEHLQRLDYPVKRARSTSAAVSAG
jgi:hypothetical protein